MPLEVLKNESCVDLVLCNEDVYALRNLLKTDINYTEGLAQIKGIGYKKNGIPVLTNPEQVVPQERMDIDLPGYAWDFLPYDKKSLDLYYAYLWHAEYDHEKRTPFVQFKNYLYN